MNNMFLKLKKGTVPESIILGRVPLLTDSLFAEQMTRRLLLFELLFLPYFILYYSYPKIPLND